MTNQLHAELATDTRAISTATKSLTQPAGSLFAAEGENLGRILEKLRTGCSLRDIRFANSNIRNVTSPPSRIIVPTTVAKQYEAPTAVHPVHYSGRCGNCHAIGARIPGLASMIPTESKFGLPTGENGSNMILYILGFLVFPSALLIFSPFGLQTVRCRSFMNMLKRGFGDDGIEVSNNNSRIASANERATPMDVHSRAHRRIKVYSSHRNTVGDHASSPDAGIAARLNKINTYKLNTMQRLTAVHKISLATSSSMELEESFNNLLHITINTLGAEIGYILQFDQEKKSFRVRSFLSCNGLPPEQGEIPLASGTLSNFVLKTGKPLLIRDIAETPQFGRRSVLGYERRSLICVPLIVRDEIIGTMAVVNKRDNSLYGSEDLKFLSTIAAQVGLVIKNAKLREDQQKAYMSIIHSLVSILDASDSYTKGHSDRVTFYSVELARKIHLSRRRIDVVERAAILHDIGKIGVNVFLLNKDKQLSPEEIEKLRRHPLIGMKILEPLDFLKDVSTCIGQHHERFDGTGYPFGLNGNDLLLESRILAIADAYDAMTSDRPYRSALSKTEAIKELEENAGKQHDPDLIRHFVELFYSDSLNLPDSNSGVTHSTFTDIDSASDYFTSFSNQPHQIPGGQGLQASRSCPSF